MKKELCKPEKNKQQIELDEEQEKNLYEIFVITRYKGRKV